MKIFLSVVATLILLAIITFFGVDYWVKQMKTLNTAAVEFIVNGTDAPEGRDRITDIGRKLEEQDIIVSRYAYYYYAWRGGLVGSVQAGRYMIESNSSLAEISSKFGKGDIAQNKPTEIRVTFKEGLTIDEKAEILRENDLPADEFLKIAKDPRASYYEQFPFLKEGASLEGYLFPDTYNFFPNSDASAIITKMLQNFDRRVGSSMMEQITAQGRDFHAVITLASVVEGEVSKPQDRELVAGIFQNRLDIDMPLQSDATIDYVKGVPEVKHTLDDIAIDSPYNTYKYPGLPAGPINSPSLESIVATVSPAESDYLFFLNSNNPENLGETLFAVTYEQHLINKANSGL